MISEIWTILCDGEEKTLSAWGIDGPVLTLNNQAPDELTFRMPRKLFDSEAPFPFDQIVTLKRSGARFFEGRVSTTPRICEENKEQIQYLISGPWKDLETTPFQQDWNFEQGAYVSPFVRVILGQSLEGTKMDSEVGIQEVIAFAISVGCNLQLGTNMPPLDVPFNEMGNISCAEALRKYLAWKPSCCTWFDYSTTPPTLNVADRADEEAVPLEFTLGEQPLSSLELIPREDLLVDGVVLKFNVQIQIGSTTAIALEVKKFPLDAPEVGRRLFVASLDWDGGSITINRQSQEIETAALPGESAGAFDNALDSDASLWWWKEKLKWLYDGSVSDVVITDSVLSEDITNLERELIKGSFQPWMLTGFSPALEAKKCTVRAKIKFTLTEGDVVKEVNTTITGNFVATNATTRVYRTSETVNGAGEPLPIGLQDSLYDALSDLQYDGQISLLERECAGGRHPGHLVNVLGTEQTAYETMRAQVQAVTMDITSGSTSLTIGPAKHLSLDELIGYLKPTRTNNPGRSGRSRKNGTSKEDQEAVQGDIQVPSEMGSAMPVPANLPKSPFQIFVREKEGGGLEAMVGTGNLYNGWGTYGTTSITGLGSWFDVSENHYVYLEADVSDGAISSIEVNSGGSLPGRITISSGDDPEQTAFVYRLGRIGSGTVPEQNLFHDLTIDDKCVDSIPCLYPQA